MVTTLSARYARAVDTLSLSWTFQREIEVPGDVTDLLVAGEVAVGAYATIRDSAVFTTKRLILRDSQGLSGKKVEIYSLPYEQIVMWSSENAGTVDLNSELQLWTRIGSFKVKLAPTLNIRDLDSLLAWAILGPARDGAPPPLEAVEIRRARQAAEEEAARRAFGDERESAAAQRAREQDELLEYSRWLDRMGKRDSRVVREEYERREQ